MKRKDAFPHDRHVQADDNRVRTQAWKLSLITGLTIIALSTPFGPEVLGIATTPIAIAALASLYVLGPRWWRPSDPVVFRAYGTGLLSFVIAVAVRDLEIPIVGHYVTLADSFDVLGYASLIYATRRLVTKRSHFKDPTNLLDSLIVSAGVSTAAIAYVVLPYMRNESIPISDRLTSAVLTFEALVLFTMIARLAIGPGARNLAYYMLALGAAGSVATELAIGYNLRHQTDVGIDGTLAGVAGGVAILFLGTSAMHPKLATLTEPTSEQVADASWSKVAVMTLSGLLPIVVLASADASRSSVEFWLALGAWAAIMAMIVLRLTGLAKAWQRARDMERVLSRAAAGLAASTDTEKMYDVAIQSMAGFIDQPTMRASVLSLEAGTWRVQRSSGYLSNAVRTDGFFITDPAVIEVLTHGAPSTLRNATPPDCESNVRADVIVAPMYSRGDLRGALVMVTGERHDDYLPEVLGSLATDVAIAVETAALIGAMHRQRSERRFRALVENSDDIIAVVSDDTTSFLSPAAARLLGYADDDIAAMSIEDLATGPDLNDLRVMIQRPDLVAGSREMRFRCADGSWRWFEVRVADLRSDAEVHGVVVTANEISDRKQAELTLSHSEARFRALVQNSSDIVAVLDQSQLVAYVSASVERVLGYSVDSLQGTDLGDLIHPEDHYLLGAALFRVQSSMVGMHRVEMRVRDTMGNWRIMDVTFTDLSDDSAVGGVVMNAHDITERKSLEHDLRHQALHDTLTGLPNRVLFRDRIDVALHRRRDGDEVAVLVIDLDDFKTINDAAGHSVGDELIKTLGVRMRSFLRGSDTAARLGGDEFAIVLDGVESRDDAMAIATRALDALREPFVSNGIEITVDGSVGVAFSVDCEAPDPEIMLRNADMALYAAKKRGKGQAAIYEQSMHADVYERLELKNDLLKAIEADELLVYYQPIIELATGSVLGFEALVRWQHPTRGMVSPGQFIPLAEDSGLIVPLGRWVLHTALGQLERWQAATPGHARPLTMSVNLSPRQLSDPHVVDDIAQALAQRQLAPGTVTLELTESSDVDQAVDIERLIAIRNLGVQLAADDFGAGYASYAALAQLPYTIVKIDMSLIQGLDGPEADRVAAQVRAVVEMAKGLGMAVVAEGVEREAHVEALVALGCERGQGYLFSPPVPTAKAQVMAVDGLAVSSS
jgi:diguanylate cyclase (GGDEF)-like protein/PAS domain S-box-containing protein